MKKKFQVVILEDIAKPMCGLIYEVDNSLNPKFWKDKEMVDRLRAIQISLNNHEETVEQNHQLQQELNAKTKELEELKKRPFFPFRMNSGNNMDFGEFILISHAWFTIPNLHEQLGIIEVEWKSSGIRKMYLGKGDSNGTNFKADVLSIALYGQKIKDSKEILNQKRKGEN